VSAPAEAHASAPNASPWPAVLCGLLVLLAWDLSDLDMPLAQWVGGPNGFPWQFHPLFSNVLHEAARTLGWVVLGSLTVLAIWPQGFLKQLSARERAGLVGSVWAALLVVVAIKGISRTSCPWDLDTFGGAARHVSHWAWGQLDGGPGRCFPAGHASTGFAFVAAHFWLKPTHPLLARRWMWIALGTGALLGIAQQVRGAHFMSHTLWTAWLCWSCGAVLWQVKRRK
jgi:membrane-associated PAP2 superfamily phosphatase